MTTIPKIFFIIFAVAVLSGCVNTPLSDNTPTPIQTPTLTPTPFSTPTSTPVIADKINLSTGKKINLTSDYNGRSIEISKGQTFNVTLETNPSTGYSWEVVELNNNILHKIGETESEPDSTTENRVGVSVMHTFQFEVINTGQTTLKIIYHRTWEKDVAPEKTFSINLTVR